MKKNQFCFRKITAITLFVLTLFSVIYGSHTIAYAGKFELNVAVVGDPNIID